MVTVCDLDFHYFIYGPPSSGGIWKDRMVPSVQFIRHCHAYSIYDALYPLQHQLFHWIVPLRFSLRPSRSLEVRGLLVHLRLPRFSACPLRHPPENLMAINPTAIDFCIYRNTPVSVVCRFVKTFRIFVEYRGSCCVILHIVKVFFASPFLKMW